MQIYSINKILEKNSNLTFPSTLAKVFFFELVNHFAYLTYRSKAQHRREDEIQHHEEISRKNLKKKR